MYFKRRNEGVRSSSSFIISVGLLFIVIFAFSQFQTISAQESTENQDPNATPAKTAEQWRKEGDDALKDTKYEEAIKAYTSAIQLQPDYLNYYKRAAVYLLRGKNNNALQDLEKVIDKKADFSQARLRRGKLYVTFGKFKEAKEDFDFILKDNPDSDIANKNLVLITTGESLLTQATAAFAAGNFQEASQLYGQLIEVAPDSLEARLKRAEALMALGEVNSILEDTMRVLKVKSDHLDALWLRGKAFYMLGQNEAAINHFREGLRYDPDNKKCRTEYKKIKKLDKHIKDGETLFNQGSFLESYQEFSSALEVDPDNKFIIPNCKLFMCKAQVKLNHPKEALPLCKEVHNMDDSSIDALSYQAEAYLLLEDFDAAIQMYQKALEKQPNSRELNEGMQRARRLQKIASRKDYYKILGVTKAATPSEIRKAYRVMALEWHPDKHTSDKEVAEKKFIEISEAYEVLSDDEKKRKYDNGEDLDEQAQHHHHNPFQGFGGGGGGPFNFNFNFGGFR